MKKKIYKHHLLFYMNAAVHEGNYHMIDAHKLSNVKQLFKSLCERTMTTEIALICIHDRAHKKEEIIK